MGECSETSRDAIGGSDWDQIMHGRPHAQERAKALIKCSVQMMRQSSVGDHQRQGQSNTAITSDLIDKVDDLVRSDLRVTLRMLALKVDVSYGTVWTIVQDRLRFRKVFAAWVPKQFTNQQKELRMGLALQHLFRYQEDPSFMKRIVTGDETWCHHYEPETKRDNTPTPTQVHQEQKTGLLMEGVVLLHDDARCPYVSRVKQMELDKFKWETLDHPPYSSDMSPCDFHVFGPLKKHLKGKRFNSDDVLKDTVKDWVSSQSQEFWEQGILQFVHQWDRCAQVYTLNKVYICTHRVISYLFI
ncbi:histone-lysine N-methyltransferase SETMAR [Trichonephila clavipes]|nr:histone-lysine N-methyltransferase SETMAR [Trichonephila clavipes]